MKHNTDYRDRIYARYASIFQGASPTFNAQAADKWGKAYRYYLRGWMPAQSNSKVVDLACGGGKLLYLLKQTGFKPIGIDVSPEQVALAHQVTQDTYQEDAIEYLERNRGAFDLITAVDLIEHFNKSEVISFLDACYSALKPGGRLVLQTPNADSPWGTVHRYNDFTHELAFNPNALTNLLALVGFESIESRELGPVPFGYSIFSSVRYVLWRLIRAGLLAWNVIETGGKGSGVVTRIFLCSAVKATKE